VATGRGRNAIYLASLGWDVTAYDLAPEALEAARRSAAEAGVKLRTVEAAHETFDFGENRWDLIVCSYAYMQPHQPEWPERLWKALAPGGTVVIQTSWDREASLNELMNLWGMFRFLHYEDLDAGMVAGEWPPSKTNPTVRLVLRKDAK
jgi:2-polyprenyl-3-methyl-5-hydroxy-6-metoxy-1,4-benzoquinol methylase